MDDELLAASSRLAAAEQRRRQLARRAAQEAAELVRKRKALEASRREQEERSARAAAARVALEVSKFWRSCLRAAQHFEVQQRQAAKTRQHFENIQAFTTVGLLRKVFGLLWCKKLCRIYGFSSVSPWFFQYFQCFSWPLGAALATGLGLEGRGLVARSQLQALRGRNAG